MSAWRAFAACAGMDTESFYDSGAKSLCLRVCRSCPVLRECYADTKAMRPYDRNHGMVRGGKWWPSTSSGYKPLPKPAEKVAAGSGRADNAHPFPADEHMTTTTTGARS